MVDINKKKIVNHVWLFIFISGLIGMVVPPAIAQTRDRILEHVKSESDPLKRIQIIEEALKNQTLKSKALALIFLERALAYKEMNDCFKAIQDLDSALAHSRSVLSALLEKSECLIRIDQTEEASRVLEMYLLSRPGSAKAYVLKGTIYEKEGFLSKAEDEFTRALYFDSNNSLALEKRARVRLKQGKPRKALEDTNEWTRIVPKDTEALILRAEIKSKLEDYSGALDDYAQAELLSPTEGRIVKEKVLVYLKTDQAKKALEAITRGPAIESDDVEVSILKARAYLLLKDNDKAESILRQVITGNPSLALAFLYSGVVQKRRNEPDGALESLNRALELDPKLVEAYKERARVFLDLKDFVRASVDLTAAANLDPSDGEIFAMRGVALLHRKLYEAAVADFSRGLEYLPGDPRLMYDRAVAYVSKDEPQLALKDLNEVLRRKQYSSRVLNLRGVVHFALGDIEKAQADLDKAVSCDPDDPAAWNNRGFLSYRMGNPQKALEDFNRALRLNPGYLNARYNLNLISHDQVGQSTSREVPVSDQPLQDPYGAEHPRHQP